MVGQKSIQGFWLSEWVPRQRVLTMLRLFRTIRNLLRIGVVTSEIAGTFNLDEVRQSVVQAAQSGRKGKILLRMVSSGHALPR